MLERARKVPVALALLISTTLTLTAPAPAADSTVYADEPYVALGDSYSAGVGGGAPYLDPPCDRSAHSYPSLYNAHVRFGAFGFVACSGATIADVLDSQVSELGQDTDLVTITVGGNDLGFGTALQACGGGTDQQCEAAVDKALNLAASTLPKDLANLYDAILAAAPGTQLAVLGYPRLFEATPRCGRSPFTLYRRNLLNFAALALNYVIQTTVEQLTASPEPLFVPVDKAFEGHRLCGSDPWINDYTAAYGAFHPTATGYRNGYFLPLQQVIGG